MIHGSPVIGIAAMDQNRGIGKDNRLPWDTIKGDMAFFKRTTTGSTLIVGARTFSNLAKLSNREVMAWSRGMTLDLIPRRDFYYVIGGAQTFKQFMPVIDEFYITHVNGEYRCDTFMPKIEPAFTYIGPVEKTDDYEIGHYVRTPEL